MTQTWTHFEDRHQQGWQRRYLRSSVTMHCTEAQQMYLSDCTNSVMRFFYSSPRHATPLRLSVLHGNGSFGFANCNLGHRQGRPPDSVLIATLHHKEQGLGETR